MTSNSSVLPPDYVKLDPKSREEFLSQMGISTPGQRSLFHDLCDKWVPEISFAGFLQPRQGASMAAGNDLNALMKRLTDLKLGCVTTRKEPGSPDRVQDKIILTSEGDHRFWFFYIGELFLQNGENPRNPFLTDNTLKSKGILIPGEILKSITPVQLTKPFIEENKSSSNLYSLVMGPDNLIVTSRDLGTLLVQASMKVRISLKNTELLAAVSRLMNSSLNDINKKMETKDALFWKSLCEVLNASRDDLAADRKLRLDRTFFQAVELFLTYMENQIQDLKKQRDDARDRENDMKQLEKLVKDEKEVLVPASDMDTHLKLLFKEKYGDQFSTFKEDFFRLYTQTAGKTGLPPLVYWGKDFIHRDNLYLFFLKNFERTQKEVQNEFRHRMQVILKTSNRGEDLSFTNQENLENSIIDFVGEFDSLTAEMLKKPKVLAEAMIQFGKVEMGIKSIDEIKPILERFFRPGTMVLRRFSSLFGINVAEYFEDAFQHMSVFVQLWVRITGQYEAYRERFVGIKLLSPSKAPRENLAPGSIPGQGGSAGPESIAPLVDDEDDLPSGPGMNPGKRKSAVERAAEKKAQAELFQRNRMNRKKTSEPVKKVQKVYSPTEQEKAWTEFKDGLRKKK